MAVSDKVRYEVLQRDNYTCRYCGASAPEVRIEVDHVQPRKHRGRDVASNLVAACRRCNGGKSATLPEEWLRREIAGIAEQWACGGDEDDYSDMHAYQDALYPLEELPAADVLRYVARVFITAMPYRPTHDELIRGAGMMAQRDAALAGNANQLAKQLASNVLGKDGATGLQVVVPDGALCP